MTYTLEVVDHKGLWAHKSSHMSLTSAMLAAGQSPGRVLDDLGNVVWISDNITVPEPERRRDPAAMLQIFCSVIMARPGLSYENAAKQAVEAYDELEKHG